MALDIAEKKSNATDLEETPQSRQRKKHAKERSARKQEVVIQEVWYEQQMNKIIQKTKMSNGSVHSNFVGMINKKNRAEIESLKKKYGIAIK